MALPPEALHLPQRLLDGARLVSDRYAMVPLLPKHGVFVEVGVAAGDWTDTVMRHIEPSLTVAVDRFKLHEEATLWGVSTQIVFGGQTHEAAYRQRFAAQIAAGTMQIVTGDSEAALATLPAASADIVYIDADHNYDPVRRDLAQAHRVVRPDGWIIVNDYIMVERLEAPAAYGVVHATNEFMIEHDWGIQFFALQTRMFCDLALRPSRCIAAATETLKVVEDEMSHLRWEVDALRRSRSWRATAPLRGIRRLASSMF